MDAETLRQMVINGITKLQSWHRFLNDEEKKLLEVEKLFWSTDRDSVDRLLSIWNSN